MKEETKTENTKTFDDVIRETEMAIVKTIEESGLPITVLELMVRNIYLQLQNLSLSVTQNNKE